MKSGNFTNNQVLSNKYETDVDSVMYRATKHVGIKPTVCFGSGGHVVGRIKHVELNLEA